MVHVSCTLTTVYQISHTRPSEDMITTYTILTKINTIDYEKSKSEQMKETLLPARGEDE